MSLCIFFAFAAKLFAQVLYTMIKICSLTLGYTQFFP
jgi:hypothetical protein